MFSNRSTLAFIVLTIGAGGLSSCKGGGAPQQQQKPVMPYKTISLEKKSTTLYAEYPATLAGIFDIEIRPKIDGYIDEIFVDEGQQVSKGQLLFRISNPQFTQDVDNQAAFVASAEAAVATAKLQVQKTKPLVEEGIISAFELKNAELNLKAKEAALLQAKATYNNAKINQGYTTITSPVSGVVGNLPYKIGSYVNSATIQPLTKISDISKVYAYFSINEKEQLYMMQNVEGKTFQDKIGKIPPVSLYLSTGQEYNKKGKIETFSGQINVQTGSFNVRAVFDNDQSILRSGSSATIKIPSYVEDVIIIPQKATVELQDKRLAYIVGKNNEVTGVPIKVREITGGQFFVVDEGLKVSDQLVIEGIGILTEGAVIKPVKVSVDSVLNIQQQPN